MRTSLVLTVIGDDRPGIVESLADAALGLGANWEESRMARLAGKFAGLLRVSVDSGHAAELATRLTTLAPGLTVVVQNTSTPGGIEMRTLRLELVGNDRPGIVRDIARALASQHINIDELETDVTSAPMTGELLFRARADLRVPAAVTTDELRRQLESLAGELMVDLDLASVDGI
jgi:glycine cleavage system regulatory protein